VDENKGINADRGLPDVRFFRPLIALPDTYRNDQPQSPDHSIFPSGSVAVQQLIAPYYENHHAKWIQPRKSHPVLEQKQKVLPRPRTPE